MKEIVNRLQENRQIELAKSILESNGYKVTKERDNNLDKDQKYNCVVGEINENIVVDYDKSEIDYSDLPSARVESNGMIQFNDVKDAVKYSKRVGMKIRSLNNISSDQEAEEFCDRLKSEITQRSLDTYSPEYRALRAVASTLKGHTLGRYGMTTAYVDIKKSSPYHRNQM